MKKVFLLKHYHYFETAYPDIKFLGIFSSRENAEKAISEAKTVEGFIDHPDDFKIEVINLNQITLDKGELQQ